MLPDEITNPLVLMQADRALARERQDATAEFACLATVDAGGQPHARFVTIRWIDAEHVTFWASGTSPKLEQLKANGKYELTAYWPTVARQYRLQGAYEWIAASQWPTQYVDLAWRAKVWGWLHEELPQSTPVRERSAFVQRFESRSAELERLYGDQKAVPPPASEGLLRLEPRQVEVLELDAERRLHDRRVLTREGDAWSQILLVP